MQKENCYMNNHQIDLWFISNQIYFNSKLIYQPKVHKSINFICNDFPIYMFISYLISHTNDYNPSPFGSF
jgi:hypothetical protein